MKNQKSYEVLFNFLNADESDETIKNILKTFSSYLVHYNKDYKYNYGFITSHIDSFIEIWTNTSIISKQCEKIRDELNNHCNGLLNFFRLTRHDENVILSIRINNAIEIIPSEESELVKLKIVGVPPPHTLKNDYGFDMEITLKYHRLDYYQIFKDVLIDETPNTNMQKLDNKNSVSIIRILNGMLDRLANDIIIKSDLCDIIAYLDCLNPVNPNVGDKNICLKFGDVFKYFPWRYKNKNTRFSSGAFEFLSLGVTKIGVDENCFVFDFKDKEAGKDKQLMVDFKIQFEDWLSNKKRE